MWLGEMLFVTLAVAFLVMVTLGIFVSANIKHVKNRPTKIQLEETLKVGELEEEPKIIQEKSLESESINTPTINSEKNKIVKIKPKMNYSNDVIVPKNIEIEKKDTYFDLRKNIEDKYIEKSINLEQQEPFFDSIDENISTNTASENISGLEPGVLTCPHCHSEVPSTIYCIYCGQSLYETMKNRI
jgi:hypothetical protein